MTIQPDPDLRTALHRIADSTSPLPVGDDLWQRGRAARRRGQVLAVAAVLALVVSVGGIATLLTTTDREARTASTEVVPGGAIPSRIVDPADPVVGSDLAVGQASVAFIGSGGKAIVVTATDGTYHALGLESWDGDLVSLSPDGRTLAWTFTVGGSQPMSGIGVLDLETGESSLRGTISGDGTPLSPEQVSWSPGSQWLTWAAGNFVGRMPARAGGVETTTPDVPVDWTAVADDGVVTVHAQSTWQWPVGGTLEPMRMNQDLAWGGDISARIDSAVASPTGKTFALATREVLPAADFLSSGRYQERALSTDIYPEGAAVRPLGWSTDTLVLARVDAPAGSYVEGPHLTLFTAPNMPEQSWTYRIVVPDIPDTDTLTVAVDLIPDLDGTSSQQLTHDFAVPQERDISWMIGLGVAAAIAVLLRSALALAPPQVVQR